MIVTRQYTLPSCNVVIHGVGDDSSNLSPLDGLPLISIMTNIECKFVGMTQDSRKTISGDKDFFEHLAKNVSSYAQEFLSGLRHPQEIKDQNGKDNNHNLVSIEKVPEQELHRLVWQVSPNDEQQSIELNTLQLFDLVEGIDLIFADQYTLPELELKLEPVSKRYRQAEETIVEQSTPAALGITGFALAAIFFFFIPAPEEIRNPNEDGNLQPNPTEVIEDSTEEEIPLNPNPNQ